jgi:hypothetical protein
MEYIFHTLFKLLWNKSEEAITPDSYENLAGMPKQNGEMRWISVKGY